MTSKFILLAAAAVLFAGCGKEQSVLVKETSEGGGKNLNPSSGQAYEPATVWEDGYLVAFRPSFENLDTKLSISADGVTAFEAGDAVLVSVDGAAGIEYQYDATEGVFKVAAGSTPVRVQGESIARIYYPFSCFSISGDNVIFSIPSYDSGSLKELGGMNPMAASAKNGDETISMKNLATVIRIDLTCKNGEESYGGSVKLSSSNTALASSQEYTVDWSGDYPVFTANAGSAAADREVSISYDGGTLNKDTACSFYFLAPYSASGNIEELTVTAEHNGNTYKRTRSDLPRSDIYNKVLWLAFRAGNFYAGTGTSEDPYQVKTVDDWCNISRLGTDGLDKHYKQVDDIDFSFDGRFGTDGKADISAYMIGDDTNKFTGSYDGDNKQLQNFSLSGTEEYTGLWRYGNNATFKNILIDNASVTSTELHVGTIVGRHDGGNAELTGCKVTNTTVRSDGNYAGGLAGRAYGTVSGCMFGEEGSTSSVKGATSIGGIVGLNYAAVSGCENLGAAVTGTSQTGGIIGNHAGEDKEVSDCVNRGGISCSGVRCGGIIGTVTKNATVSGCVNHGAVGDGTSNYKGGIIGSFYCQTTGKTLTITDAVNHGPVNGNSGIGGIIGGTDNAENQADDVFIVINGETSNSGAVTGANTNIGGIIGYPNKTTLTIGGTSCTNSEKVTGKTNVGGIVGNVVVSGTISSCTNSGEVEATITNNNAYAGGIVGLVNSTADITSCVNNGNVTAVRSGIGGIVGLCKGGTIDMCMNTAKIYGHVSNSPNVGGIVGCIEGGTAVTVKRCYNSKSAECRGSNRIGGIVGMLNIAGSQVVNCATYGRVIGAGNGTNFCAGALIGQCNVVALVANCLVRDLGKMVVATHASSTNKYLLGYIVGYVAAGATFQSCLAAGVAHHIQDKTTHAGTSGTVNASTSYSGSALSAGDGKTKSILCGKDVSGATFKDMFFRGNSTCPCRWNPSTKTGTYTTCHWLSTAYNTNYSFNTYAQKAVTLSDGTTTFAAKSKYPAEIMTAASGLITDYTPAEGEEMGWSDVVIGSNTHYPIPTALDGLFNGQVSE